MYVEIEMQLLCLPNTAFVYALSRALRGLLKEQADYLIAIRDLLSVKQSTQQ